MGSGAEIATFRRHDKGGYDENGPSGVRPRPSWFRASPPLSDAEHRGRLDLDTRPHRRGDGDAMDKASLGAGRLSLLNSIGESLDVFHELLGRERSLADA